MPTGDQKRRRVPYSTPLLPKTLTNPNPDSTVQSESGFSGAVFNLSTTIVGAGIMALPATLKQLGMIPGLIAILLVGVLTESSVDMILRFSRASKSNSYAGLVADAFGGPGRTLLQIGIVVNNLGLLVVYMIIIGDVLSGTWSDGEHHLGLMQEWFGHQWWTSRFVLLLLTSVFVFSPLISFKRVAGVTITKIINGSITTPRLHPDLVDQTSFLKLFTTVPVLVTAYICHHNVHPIDNELKDPSQMKSIVKTSIILCSSVYIATGFFGFLLFGDHTQGDVLANFDGDLGIPYSSLINDIVRISYCLHLMLVFPIIFFSLRLNLDGLLFPYAIPIAFDNRRFFMVTGLLLGFVFLGANFVPSIWDAFQFTGATATVSVGFIFPAAVALRDTHGIATKKDRRVSWVMITLAVSSSVMAIFSDIYTFCCTNKLNET
ncbi:amino acid transporter AVT6A-like isoform X2 [Bidens hawaiensis]|uniref:amino acid transporter AVT6A-like isoform X2 n=1 Tax=Bidens hawaiensis TaxID=980011 RepID=UPI00404A4941